MRHRRYHRDMLKSEETLVTEVVRCPNLTHYDHVFDANAVFPIGIIARFYTLLVNFGCDRGGRSAIPFETVMPGFSGVLLNAAQRVLSMRMGDALNGLFSPIRVPIPCGPGNVKFQQPPSYQSYVQLVANITTPS